MILPLSDPFIHSVPAQPPNLPCFQNAMSAMRHISKRKVTKANIHRSEGDSSYETSLAKCFEMGFPSCIVYVFKKSMYVLLETQHSPTNIC